MFGFDKEAYEAHMSRVRVGTSGWNYPTGQGTWNGVFYPIGAGAAEKRKSRLRRARNFTRSTSIRSR